MRLVKPNYGRRTPIVNHINFTDARPTLGSPAASFNPGQSDGLLPKGPPKYIQAPGRRPPRIKGESNKRY